MLSQTPTDGDGPRDTKLAITRSLCWKCPRCGKGALFSSYLKVRSECALCGLDLTPQRADDGPAYVVILIVCHIAGVMLTVMWGSFRIEPIMMAMVISCTVIVLALALLPSAKGFFVAIQWANRMHGFATLSAVGS